MGKTLLSDPIKTLKAAELCAGYGGLALAVNEVFGSTTAWFSEFEDAPSRILAHHWPNVPNHGDMTKIDWATVEPVEIVAAGTPCQDLAYAGKRGGMTEGTRSNLWVQMREAIAIIQPTYVVWENVPGAYSAKADSEMEPHKGCMGKARGAHLRAIGRVLGDLASLGFDAEWRYIRASDLGACHRRARVFVLATHPERLRRTEGNPATERRAKGANGPSRLDERPALHSGIEWGKYRPAIQRHERAFGVAPDPTEPTGRGGQHRSSPAFYEWAMGLPAGWITDVPDLSWADQITAAGNGVVPQQAIAALRDMLATREALEVA